jgi:hypothetical protein
MLQIGKAKDLSALLRSCDYEEYVHPGCDAV